MSAYTDGMVNQMTAQGSYTYEQAVAFAQENDLSTRSVISKIKSLGLEYTPKAKAPAKAGNETRKSDIVSDFASEIGADPDALAGLAKADKRALTALVSAFRSAVSNANAE